MSIINDKVIAAIDNVDINAIAIQRVTVLIDKILDRKKINIMIDREIKKQVRDNVTAELEL